MRNYSVIVASMATAFVLLCSLHSATMAGTIAVSGYTYNNLGDLNAIAGKDAPSGEPQALIDGQGKAGEYTPGTFFWDAGQEGTIYNEANGDIEAGQPQPSVTFDLGDTYDLGALVVHYGERTPSGVVAPAAVEVLVDGNSLGSFGGFDNTPTSGDAVSPDYYGAVRSNTIGLTGASGQFVELRFHGNLHNPELFSDSWLGLMEVEFNQVAEPATSSMVCLMLATMIAGGLARRRKPVQD